MKTYAEALFNAKRGFIIIGVTGYTGSGCTSLAGLLYGDKKPDLPARNNLESLIDEQRYLKLQRVWEEIDWHSFVNIDVSRIIFMFAIHRALRGNFKTGLLADLRRLALSQKKDLVGLTYLFQESANLRDSKAASKLITSYKTAMPLYGQFKKLTRFDLNDFIELMQNFGDDLRRYGQIMPIRGVKSSPANMYVLPEAMRRLVKAYRIAEKATRFVIDAFRNPYEVEFFKRRYNEFYLIGIQRPEQERQETLLKALNYEFIQRLEKREKGNKIERSKDNIAEWITSQNIAECLQKADIFIENIKDNSKTWPHLRFYIVKILSLARMPGCIPPNVDERCMHFAMSARQNSGCLSRHVGAVVVDRDGYVLGVGWNDAPTGQVPCALRTGKQLIAHLDANAFSEYERSDEFVEHVQEHCALDRPFCFKEEYSLIKGTKMAEFTRALHAEENAFFQATKHGKHVLKGATLYTSDAPCTLCSKKAYQLKIDRIVYIEDYPGIAQDQTIKTGEHKIDIKHFEGITGEAYLKLFCPLMPEKDFIKIYEKT